MAGDDWALKGSFVFTNGKETDYGLVALVLNSDKITLKGMASYRLETSGNFSNSN